MTAVPSEADGQRNRV